MDKTVKIRPLSGDAKGNAPQSNLTEDQDKALELAKRNAQLEEEKRKSLEQLKMIEQLKESLQQERAKIAELSKNGVAPDANELAVKEAQLEEEKRRSLENLKMIVQLRESLKHEQAKTAEMVKMMAEQEARIKGAVAQEASELAQKNAQFESEKKKSLEQMKAIEQLQEGLKQEQAKVAEATKKASLLEAKVRELTEVLGKISGIAAAGKAD